MLFLGDSHGYHFSVSSDAMRQSFLKKIHSLCFNQKIAMELTMFILCGI